MTKALIVLTNVAKYDSLDRPTGLWLSELTHFYDVMRDHQVEVDFVSPTGGYIPLDPHSMMSMDATDWKYYQDSDFRNQVLGATLSPDQVVPQDYDLIYYAGGHGAMWDFPASTVIADIASQIYQNNGIVAAICHGVAGLLPIKDEKGEPLVANKRLTGFSNTEEAANETTDAVPFLAEDALKELGANYQAGPAFTSCVQVDGRLLTGQNPQSARDLAETVIEHLG